MQIYVLSRGKFVIGASASLDDLQAIVEKTMAFERPIKSEWRVDPHSVERSELYYMPARSGRWNASAYMITGIELTGLGDAEKD